MTLDIPRGTRPGKSRTRVKKNKREHDDVSVTGEMRECTRSVHRWIIKIRECQGRRTPFQWNTPKRNDIIDNKVGTDDVPKKSNEKERIKIKNINNRLHKRNNKYNKYIHKTINNG